MTNILYLSSFEIYIRLNFDLIINRFEIYNLIDLFLELVVLKLSFKVRDHFGVFGLIKGEFGLEIRLVCNSYYRLVCLSISVYKYILCIAK